MKAHTKHRLLKILLTGAALLVLFSPLYMYFSHDVEALNRLYPHNMASSGEPVYKLKQGRPKGWVRINEISKSAKGAIVISEDWAFYQHHGIDVNQLKTAIQEILTFERFRGQVPSPNKW